jgi:hypothetical protein
VRSPGLSPTAPGLFEAAHGGTIFLDEISKHNRRPAGKTSARHSGARSTQNRLRPKAVLSDVRVIVATNTSLDALVQQRLFRSGFAVSPQGPPHQGSAVEKPALKTFPLLAENFVDKLNAVQRSKKYATPKFIENLAALPILATFANFRTWSSAHTWFAKGSAITAVALTRLPTTAVPGD